MERELSALLGGRKVDLRTPPGEMFDELLGNIYATVEGCLSVDIMEFEITEKDKVMEIVV